MYNHNEQRYLSNEEFKLNDKQKGLYKEVPDIDKNHHMMSFWSETNPAVCRLYDPFKNIYAMEVTKICIPRSENTCEYYRNCAFISLFSNYRDIIEQNNSSDMFMADIGVTDYNYDTLIQQLNNNATSQSINLITKLNFKYDCSIAHTLNTNTGTVPYILESIAYSISSLVSALNAISTMYTTTNLPYITSAYNTDTQKLFFYSTELFYIIPGNAYQVLGLSPYKIYISQYNVTTNTYIVNADLAPMLRGPQCLFIKNDESTLLRPNCLNTSLYTFYFHDQNDNNQTINVTCSMSRPVQMQLQTVQKLTFTLYSDVENKILYQTHNSKWYMEVCIFGN